MTADEIPSRLIHTPQGGYQVNVHDEPYLILGGELQNSSFSSAEYMRTIWPKLVEDKVNTALVGVYWSMVEPEEGVFDFGELDEMIADARSHRLKLILLWFGSWKNGMSTYVPPWIKKDNKRFPRARVLDGDQGTKIAEVLSVFSEQNVETDRASFAVFMQHLRDIDIAHGTVIMVQVENEVGLLGASRDLAEPAQRAYAGPVPLDLLQALSSNWDGLHPALRDHLDQSKLREGSSWSETFGSSAHADEIFMAYHYAVYVEKVAKVGKKIYPLPLFTNAWLSSVDKDADAKIPVMAGGGESPGDWPCGGPNIGVLDIWQAFAPSLDFFCPDIYLHLYSKIIGHWRHNGQPLFVPEQRRDAMGLRWMWEAFGTHGALAASPFGIDSLDSAGRDGVRDHFGLLSDLQYYILRSQRHPGSCYGFWFDEIKEGETILNNVKTVRFGSWELTIKRAFVPGQLIPAYGAIFPLADNRFLIAGEGYQIHFKEDGSLFSGIVSFNEKIVTDPASGRMRTYRRFNGDEIVGGKCVVMPSRLPDEGGFPIAIFIPSGTRIAEVEVYSLFAE